MASRTTTRGLTLVLVGLAVGSSLPIDSARAEESPATPRHLVAYGLDWLNYVSPEDLPATRYAVCVVDTGTQITPDTPIDSPQGPIVERLSTDGGPGTPMGDAPQQLHGTRMAMDAIAPANGWGTIGATTWGRVVSVRAQVGDETTLREDAYRKGISRCIEALGREPIAAVSLSFGCSCSFSANEEARIADAVGQAKEVGMSVVAAAGNSGGPAESPASSPDVTAVAGGAPDGSLCGYSSYDAHVAMVGPACPVDDADPLTGVPAYDMGAGSSAATVTAATLIAALRTLRPEATASQVEAWVQDSAKIVGGHRVLDGDAAARRAGLGPIVDRARSRMAMQQPMPSPSTSHLAATPAPTPTGSSSAGPAPNSKRRLAAPLSVRVRWSQGKLTVSTRGRVRGALLRVRAQRLGEFGLPDRSRTRSVATSRLTLSLRWRPDRVLVQFVPGRGSAVRASRARILRRARSGRFR